MSIVPLVKREASNSENHLDWKYGEKKSNVILENSKLNVQILRYYITSPNGEVFYDTISIRESKKNSVAVIRNEKNEIGLIKEWRPIPAKWFWACVRGFGDPDDEDSLATAKREVIEEIGSCTIIDSRKIGVFYQNTTFYENPVGIVLLGVEKSSMEVPEDTRKLENAIVDFQFFSINDIKRMIGNGEIDDLFSMSALARYIAMEGLL